MIEMTSHGYERTKERGNKKGGNAQAYATRAYLKGKDVNDCHPVLQKYVANVLEASSGDTIRVWSNQVFLFGHNKLITVFPIPSKLQKKMNRR